MTTEKSMPRGFRILGALLLFGAAFAAAFWFDQSRFARFDEPDTLPPTAPAPQTRRIRLLDASGAPLSGVMAGLFDAEFGVRARRRFASRGSDVGRFDAVFVVEESEVFSSTFGDTDADGFLFVPWTDRPLTVVFRDGNRCAARAITPGDRDLAAVRLAPDRIVSARVVGKAGPAEAGKPVGGVVVVFSARESAGGPVTERVLAISDERGVASVLNAFVAPAFLTAAVFPQEADAAAIGTAPPDLPVEDLPSRSVLFAAHSPGSNPAILRFLGHGLNGGGTTDALAAELCLMHDSSDVLTLRTPEIGGKPPEVIAVFYEDPMREPQVLSLAGDRTTTVPAEYVAFGSNVRSTYATPLPEAVRWRRRITTAIPGTGDLRRPSSQLRTVGRSSLQDSFSNPFFSPGAVETLTIEAVGELGRSGDRPGAVVVGAMSVPLPLSGYSSLGLKFGEAWPTSFCLDVVDAAGRAMPGVSITFDAPEPYCLMRSDGRFELSNGRKATMLTDTSGRIVGYAPPNESVLLVEYEHRTAAGTTRGGVTERGPRPIVSRIRIP